MMKSIKLELSEYVVSAIGVIAGLLLLIFPQQSISIITYGVGAVSLVYGVIKIVSYLQNRDISFFFTGELILGIILVGIGIFSFTNPGGIFAILPIILGILVIVEGASKIQRAIMLKRCDYPQWGAAVIVGAAIAALGVLLIINPFGALVVTVRVLGAVLLADGISGIWVSLMLKRFS